MDTRLLCSESILGDVDIAMGGWWMIGQSPVATLEAFNRRWLEKGAFNTGIALYNHDNT
jgi:hypothetical protein